MATRRQERRDSAADWTSTDPTLAEGEIGYETDSGLVKIGDGSTAWTSLGYAAVLPVTTTDNAVARYNGTAGQLQDSNLTISDDDTLTTVASDATAAGLNVPHGTAPSAPANGDVWTTTAGIYVRVNGATVGPLISAATADVVGPGSSTDNTVVRFDSTTGKLLQGSSVVIDDSNHVSGIVNLTTTGNTILGNATTDTLGFYGATPVDQAAALTAAETTITYTAPSVADYALQDVTNTSPYGFVDAEELRTFIGVVANLQARVNELEAALDATTGVGLIA